MHVKHDFSSDENYWKGDRSLFPSFLLLVLLKSFQKKKRYSRNLLKTGEKNKTLLHSMEETPLTAEMLTSPLVLQKK